MHFLDTEKLTLLAAFLMLVIAVLLTVRRNRSEQAGIFLVFYAWFSFYTMFMTYMVSFGYVTMAPHLFRTGLPVSLLIMPASYFYIRQSLRPGKFMWMDLVHVVPTLFVLIDFFPFLMLSATEKLAIIEAKDTREMTIGFSQGQIIPTYGYSIIRYLLVFVYTIIQFRMIGRAEQKGQEKSRRQQVFFTWLKVFVIAEVAYYVIPLVAVLVFGLSSYAISALLSGVAVVFVQAHYLFFNPDILYGIREQKPAEPAKLFLENPEPLKNEAIRAEYFSEEELEQVGQVLGQYMREHKPYLKGKLKLQELARATGYPVAKVSAYINRNRNQNFFAYLNEFRISECREKFDSGEHNFKTLEALAEECGFPNRATFIRVFKQVEGKTPSEYLSGRR